jgi:hypothetical protein
MAAKDNSWPSFVEDYASSVGTKRIRAAVLIFALSLSLCPGEDWTVQGQAYRGVTVLSYGPSWVTILDADGHTTQFQLSQLPPDLQKRFHYDPVKLAALKAAAEADLAAKESAPAKIYAKEVTPAMEHAFLVQLKTAIAHRDYKLFRSLLFESGENGGWLRVQDYPAYAIVFSDAPRVYVFGPPWLAHDGINPITPRITPIVPDQNWRGNAHASGELYIVFPGTIKAPGLQQSWDVQTNSDCSFLHVPLVVRQGRLLAARETWMIN